MKQTPIREQKYTWAKRWRSWLVWTNDRSSRSVEWHILILVLRSLDTVLRYLGMLSTGPETTRANYTSYQVDCHRTFKVKINSPVKDWFYRYILLIVQSSSVFSFYIHLICGITSLRFASVIPPPLPIPPLQYFRHCGASPDINDQISSNVFVTNIDRIS